MKKILYFVIVIVFVISCSKNNTKITGEILNATGKSVYLNLLNVDSTICVDSTTINNKGEFTLKTDVTSPTFFNISIGAKETITLFMNPDTELKVTGNYNDLSKNYKVEGSEGSLWIKELNTQLTATQFALDSLRKAYLVLPTGDLYAEKVKNLNTMWHSVINKQIKFSKDFILEHAISPVSYYALYQKMTPEDFILIPENDLHTYKIVATSLKAMHPESQYTKAILKHLEEISLSIRQNKIKELIANSDHSLPKISLTDIEGDTITLNSLKGKYIILDFTVLGSQDSRQHHQELKEVYKKFKGRGVQIYQVCLDENEAQWKGYVKGYGINWVCVRDPKNLQSSIASNWNIKNIPANYIINPEFEIVGKNLFGQRLQERLTDLLK